MSWTRLLDLPDTTLVDNILSIYHAADSATRAQGTDWYPAAHTQLQILAQVSSIPLPVVAAVTAILSPSVPWERNLKEAYSMALAYAEGRRRPPTVSTYGQFAVKAWNVLLMQPTRPDLLFGRRALKTRDFYLSLLAPSENSHLAVVDTHAARLALRQWDIPPLHAKGRYYPLQAAFQAAAQKAGISAQAMQAITWLAWRDNPDLN